MCLTLFSLRIVITINLRNHIEHSRVLATGLYTSFEPRQNQLQPIALFNFMYEFVDWEIARYRSYFRHNQRPGDHQ